MGRQRIVRMKYFIMGDEDTVLGFGMVGVEGRTVDSAEEARAVFNEVLQNEEIGIIIITERTAESIRELIQQFIFTKNFPLIVEVPDRSGHAPGWVGIRHMVNAAIGIKL